MTDFNDREMRKKAMCNESVMVTFTEMRKTKEARIWVLIKSSIFR